MSNETNGNLTSKPVVRLCHLVKWPGYDGYGFNLHANMNKPGQFIGTVEDGSPAQAAGLKEGDRIIEVNGANVNGEVHKQVVSRIKQNPNETKLLVVDKESSEYFQANNITITGTMAEVKPNCFIPLIGNPGQFICTCSRHMMPKTLLRNLHITAFSKMQLPHPVGHASVLASRKSAHCHKDLSQVVVLKTPPRETQVNGNKEPEEAPNESPQSEVSNNHTKEEKCTKLNLNMTVNEYRSKLASRKKYDPKKETMAFKKKHEIIDTL